MNRFARFALVGILGTGFDFLVFAFALQTGTAPALARAFGYLAGSSLSFLLNRKWVFAYSARGSRLMRFIAVYSLSGFIAVSLQHYLGLIAPENYVFFVYSLVTLCSAILNYLGLKRFVFSN